MAKPLDLTNQRFGRLVAKCPAIVRPGKERSWFCKCDCGGTTVVITESLRSGKTKSCGCLSRECGQRLGKRSKVGTLNPNWRGGRHCIDCGRPAAKGCKRCGPCNRLSKFGEGSPRWGRFTSTDPHQGRRRAGRRKILGMCERCGTKPATDRHHKDHNPLNNTLDNIEGLCRRCHMVEDGRLNQLVNRNRTGRRYKDNAEKFRALRARRKAGL